MLSTDWTDGDLTYKRQITKKKSRRQDKSIRQYLQNIPNFDDDREFL